MLVEKWNTQRTQALGHSLLRVLYPLMERELRTKLLQEAKEFVTQVCVLAYAVVYILIHCVYMTNVFEDTCVHTHVHKHTHTHTHMPLEYRQFP